MVQQEEIQVLQEEVKALQAQIASFQKNAVADASAKRSDLKQEQLETSVIWQAVLQQQASLVNVQSALSRLTVPSCDSVLPFVFVFTTADDDAIDDAGWCSTRDEYPSWYRLGNAVGDFDGDETYKATRGAVLLERKESLCRRHKCVLVLDALRRTGWLLLRADIRRRTVRGYQFC